MNIIIILYYCVPFKAFLIYTHVRFSRDSYNVVALDFLGHGESPSPHQPALYTVDEVVIDTCLEGMVSM